MRLTALLVWAIFGLSMNGFAQAYKVNVLVDVNTAIPGGTGNFALAGDSATSTDGRYVAFVHNNPNNLFIVNFSLSIYTYDTKTAQFAKIADTSTIPPGGSAAFGTFFNGYNNPNEPLVSNGTVVFWGAYPPAGAGIYSAPAAGGAIKLIVNTGMSTPGGGTFTNAFSAITTDGAKVAFTAEISTGSTGTYTANLDGTALTRIGDSNVIVNAGNIGIGYDDWYYPSISNGEVAVFSVVGAGDPSRGQNAIFTTPYTGITGDAYPYTGPPRATETVSTTNLPGNPNANFHTRFDAFALSNNTLGIYADDANSTYSGIFSAPAAPGQVNAPLTKLADSIDNPNIALANGLGIANDNGTIVFGVRDIANNGIMAVFAYVKGQGLVAVAESYLTPVANRAGVLVEGISVPVGLNSAANGAIAFTSGKGTLYLATPNTTAITSVTTASGGSAIAQNTWIQIYCNNLVPATTPAAGVLWSSAPSFAQGQLPTQLNGIGVTVNGKPGFVYFFCSATTNPACATDQINVLTPLDTTIGPVQIVVTSGTAASPAFTANMQAVVPTFLLFPKGYVTATHANGSLLGPTTLYPGASTPAKVGETVVVFSVGFGLPTTTVVNGSSTQSGPLPSPVTCSIGGASATVAFAGLISPGLYQLNIVVPPASPSGDNPITCSYNGSSTPTGLIAVQ